MKYLAVLAALFALSSSFSFAIAGDTKPAPQKGATVTTEEDHDADQDGADEEGMDDEEDSDAHE